MQQKFSTYFYTANLLRRNPSAPISNIDIQNYVSEGLWKGYDSLRREASLRLGLNELEVGVSDIRIITMKVDGFKVTTPEGFSGKSIQITYLMTFAAKGSIESVRGLFETGSIKAYLAAQNMESDNVLYAESREKSTSIFGVFPNKTVHLIDCPWGMENLASNIGGAFGSSDNSVNKVIYSRFLNGATGDMVREKLKRLFLSSFQTFINSLSSVFMNIKPVLGNKMPLLLLDGFPAPEFVPEKRFSIAGKRAKITPISISEAEANDFIAVKSAAYSDLNEIARLRVGWLINKN